MARTRLRSALLALVALGVQAALGLLLARIYLTSQNTLANNGRWVSSKTLVDRSLMGAESFMRERQALAGNRVDLGAWHGHQEILLAEPVTGVTSLRFEFRLEPGASLSAIVDRPEQQPFTAVRLSSVQRPASALLRVRPSGEFVRRTRLARRKVEPETWHRVEVSYGAGTFELILDGASLGSFELPERGERRIGFRGSGAGTLVDDIVIRAGDRIALNESFSGPRHSTRITAWTIAGVLAANLLAVGAIAFSSRGRRRTAGFAYAMISTTLIVVAGLVLGFVYLQGKAYPFAEDLEGAEARTREREIARIRSQVRRNHATEAPPEVHRLLVLGTSQTWGSGALKHRHVWVSVLERLLNDDPKLAGGFETINGGIASARSFHLARALEEEWLALGPRTVIVSLGINDTDLEAFEASLEKIVDLSLGAEARPLLVLEPTAPHHWDGGLRERHRVMERVAEARGVPVIDMHAYLDRRRDDGFLWWDLAHLTSFGQRLFAEKLYEELGVAFSTDPAAQPD